jgi:coenzyme F420-reducing hydrogenase alpha subunit
MSVEGHVTIDVDRGGAPAVRVSFTQPGEIARVLEGRTPADAVAIIPALYSLCGKAQSHAARLALDAAEGRERANGSLAAMQCLTEMESLRENALRIALDWPRYLGERADTSGLKSLMRLVPDLQAVLQSGSDAGPAIAGMGAAQASPMHVVDEAEGLLAERVFGEPLVDWQARQDADAVDAWAAKGRTAAARLLHHIRSQGNADAGSIPLHRLAPLDPDTVLAWLAAGPGHALPLTRGAPVPETTLLARHAGDRRIAGSVGDGHNGHGLWARMTARLIELSQATGRMRALIEGRIEPDSGRLLGEAIGMAEVMAARGRLLHVAAIEGGRIKHYRVLAPTRWNFGADGAAARAVERIVAEYAQDAPILAEMMVNAIDPCVACSVRIH